MTQSPPDGLQENVALAPLTTLELGGPARWYVRAASENQIKDALQWASSEQVEVLLLGGGSNVVIDEGGWPGLVIHMDTRGVRPRCVGNGEIDVTVAAGEPWDPFVERTVGEGWVGLECLSGIPGSVGATPIQNVGAYGHEVSHTLQSVRVLDRTTGLIGDVPNEACDFAYRHSLFKETPHRWVVLSVTFRLLETGVPVVRYPELARAISRDKTTVSEVRHTVLQLRRSKSMVIDPHDPNRRSVGSFFTNPIVSTEQADAIAQAAVGLGAVKNTDDVPRFATDPGLEKIPAAWLIEKSGWSKGHRQGPVGISTKHSLALVHHGGATAADLIKLALQIRDSVHQRFGVTLKPEPNLIQIPWNQ